MTLTAHSLLLIIAVVLFVVATCGWAPPRISLGWLGLAFFAAAFLVT